MRGRGFPIAVIVVSVMMLASAFPMHLMVPSSALALPVEAPRQPTRDAPVYYMNKTVSPPIVDGNWGATEWTKLKKYDISPLGGSNQCLMYIGFDASNGGRIYVGLDVTTDTTQDTNTAESEYLQVGFDGDNDGKVTYTNPTGLPEDEIGDLLPITYGGLCKDRWANIFGWNANEAGWLSNDGSFTPPRPQLWRDTYGYEATDGMRAGFSGGHRFYEYSIDYRREMGTSPGATSMIGVAMAIWDGLGDNNANTRQLRGYFPSNYSNIGGPWAHLALAQAPEAAISAPAQGDIYYTGEDVPLDASASTDDNLAGLTYAWNLDDGGTASGKNTTHKFATIGQHLITLNVTDTDGLSNISRTTVTIKDRNVPPVIDSFYPAEDPTVTETDKVAFGVNVSDANTGVGDWLYINWSLNGTFKKSELKVLKSNFSVTTDYDGPLSAGSYTVAVAVQDTYDVPPHDPVVHAWTLTVLNRNRAPVVTLATPDVDQISVAENSTQEFSIEYMDPDGDAVTLQWKLDNGTMVGTRDKTSVRYSPDFNASGVHELKVALTDKLGAVTERRWSVLVTNVDRSPRITASSPADDSISVLEGKSVLFTIGAFDPDGEQLIIRWYVGSDEVDGANATSYSFRAQYEGEGSSDSSPYKIRVAIRDPFGMTDERSWELAVENVNRPPVPVIDEPSDESLWRLGSTVRFRADRSWDPDSADNGSLSFSWDFGDSTKGATASVVTHRYDRTGNFTVRFTVRDRAGSAASAYLNLTVEAPVLSITDLSFDPPLGAMEEKRVNIVIRVQNDGDAEAQNVRVKLTMDGASLTTMAILSIAVGESQDVHWAWNAVAGPHIIRASIEPAADTIISDQGSVQKDIAVKAKPVPAKTGISSRDLMIVAGVAVAAVVLGAVGFAVFSRRRRARAATPPPGMAPWPQPQMVTYGQMTPLMSYPPAAAPAGAPPVQGPAWASAPQPSQAPAAEIVPAGAPPAGQAGTSAAFGEGQAAPLPAQPQTAPYPAQPQAELPANGPAPAAQTVAETATAPAATAPQAAAVGPAQPAPAPAPATASACPSCGEPVEGGWAVCPACSTALGKPAPPPAPVEQRATATPAACPKCSEPVEAGWKACPSCGEQLAAAAEAPAPSDLAVRIEAVRQKLLPLAEAGKDISKVQGQLDLAVSFQRTGKSDKAESYLGKAREALAELEK